MDSRSYNSAVRRRNRMRRRLHGYLMFAGAAVGVCLAAWAVTALLTLGDAKPEEQAPITGGVSANILAPLPMQGGTSVVTASFGPARQTAGEYTLAKYNSATLRRPACGQVDLSYFSDAAFVGDSLTVGFSDYNINLSGALVCGYIGIGPDAVVNRKTVTHPTRGGEIVLDVLAENQPKKVYVLLGTNTLVNVGNEDSFLAYYDKMLDSIRETVGEAAEIYVQSIPPVRASVTASKPGLESGRLQSVNESLALLAAEKGCSYIDLWEAMADENGEMRAEYDGGDGVHFSAGKGYTAWVNYLRTHTKYSADSPWTPGSAFAQ